MSTPKLNRPSARAAGFSLVELMISLAIGSVIIAGAVYVYSQSRTTYGINESMGRLQEEARYAFSLIEPDIQLAGYYGYSNDYNDVWLLNGGVSTSVNDYRPTNVPAPGLAASITRCGRNFAVDLMATVQGRDNGFVLNPGAAAPGPASGCATNIPLASSDTFTIRRASTNLVPATVNRLQLYINRNERTNSKLFVTGVAPGAIVPGTREVRNLIVRTYYVSRDSDGRPGFPSLRMISLGAGQAFTDTELIPGVEDMEVQFGVDNGDYNNDGLIDEDLQSPFGIPDAVNGIATQYVNANDPILQPPPAGRSAQIVTIRIWLRLRAEQPELGFQDNRVYNYAGAAQPIPGGTENFRRLLVSRTIYLRNARTL